jgi:hypothetical protein
MSDDKVKKIIDQYLEGDKESAIQGVKELKSEGSYFEDVAPYFNEVTDPLFTTNLDDALNFYLILTGPSSEDIFESLSRLFGPISVPLSMALKNFEVNESPIGTQLFLIRNVFHKSVSLGLKESELSLLSSAGIDSIEVQLSPTKDGFEFVEKREEQSKLVKSIDSLRESIVLFAMKNLTPKTVAVATVAISVGMQLLGSSSAHADMVHAHNLLGGDSLGSVLNKISDHLSTLGAGHSHLVKIVANDVVGTATQGHGHFTIQVGDCVVTGDYGLSRHGAGESNLVNVVAGISQHAEKDGMSFATAACHAPAVALKEVLTHQIFQALGQ